MDGRIGSTRLLPWIDKARRRSASHSIHRGCWDPALKGSADLHQVGRDRRDQERITSIGSGADMTCRSTKICPSFPRRLVLQR